MNKILVLLAVVIMWLPACASTSMRQDCQARKQRAERVAAIAAEELKRGWTAQEVRSALGEPDEIVTAKGVGEFDIWKYYLLEDCKAQLGMTAPKTELFFFHGNLVNFTTFPQ